MSTRRKFLADSSTALAALALAPISLVGRAAVTGGDSQSFEHINYAGLAGQVNTPFRVRLSPLRVVELTLLKAPLAPQTPKTPGCPPPGDAGNEKFSLIFSGPEEALLASAIHQFEHEKLGRFAMYIGQFGIPEAGSVRYEAVFNRRAPAATPLLRFT